MIVSGYVLTGIGLIFLGIKLLTAYLKNSATLDLKEKLSLFAKNPVFGFFLGGILILFSQSSSAAVLMLICVLKAGMIQVVNCFPAVIGVNVCGAATMFILAFDIKVFIYFTLGISAIVFTNDYFYKFRTFAGIFIGIGLIFLGLYTIQEAVSSIHEAKWFSDAILFVNKSYLIGFVIGILLSLVTQSSFVIQAILMVLYKEGVVNLYASMFIVYGAYLGSSALTAILSINLSGEAKQVAAFQVLYNTVGAILLLAILCVEVYGNITGISFLLTFIFTDKGFQLAAAGLLFDLIAGIAMFLLIPTLSKILATLYPETPEESISKSRYLFSSSVIDVNSAMKMVELEQSRLIEANIHIFMLIRQGKDQMNIGKFIDGLNDLAKLVRDYVSALPRKYSIESTMCYKLGLIFDIQNSIETLILSVRNLSMILSEKSLFSGKEKKDFYNALIEGTDTLLMAVSDILHGRDNPFNEYLPKIVEQSKNNVVLLRTALIRSLEDENSETKFKLLSAISEAEKSIIIIHKLTEKIFFLKQA